MSEAAINSFTSYFGKPIVLASALIAILMICFILALYKITKNGIEESQYSENIDHSDVIKYVLRGLIVILVMAAFLGL